MCYLDVQKLVSNKKGYNNIKILYTSSHKSFKVHFSCKEKKLKCILTYLSCTEYNKINICHLDVKKQVFYKKWYNYYKYFVYRLTENFPIHYGLEGEMF